MLTDSPKQSRAGSRRSDGPFTTFHVAPRTCQPRILGGVASPLGGVREMKKHAPAERSANLHRARPPRQAYANRTENQRPHVDQGKSGGIPARPLGSRDRPGSDGGAPRRRGGRHRPTFTQGAPNTASFSRRQIHVDLQDQGRHRTLLQGLGIGTARSVQPWLAAQFRRLGGSDVLPGLAWLSLHRA